MTGLNLCGLCTVRAGCSGADVSYTRCGVSGRPSALLLRNVKVGLCVKVCPPHQHLNKSTCINRPLEVCENKMHVLDLNFEYSSVFNNLCHTVQSQQHEKFNPFIRIKSNV